MNLFKGATVCGQRKNYQPSILPEIKSWCVDLLAETHFDGADTLEHKWAKRFWEKSGRRLKHV